MGVVYGIDDAEGDEVDDDLPDPAVPFTDVVSHSLGLNLDFPADRYTVEQVEQVNGQLKISSVEENIWAYNEFGVRFGEDGTLPQPECSEDKGATASEDENDLDEREDTD